MPRTEAQKLGINVQIERDDREVQGAALLDPQNRVARALAKAWQHGRGEYPMATSIDPYGDTLLNYLMIDLLLPELERLQAAHPEDTEVLVAIKELGAHATQEPHCFLAFIGD